jgi:hypothetical protein
MGWLGNYNYTGLLCEGNNGEMGDYTDCYLS